MSECVHEAVCKLKIDAEDERCSLTQLCKYFDNGALGPVDRPKVKKYRKCQPMIREAPPVKEDEDEGLPKIGRKEYDRARNIIKCREHDGQVSENQKLALAGMKGKHFTSLTEVQKKQVVSIANTPIKEAGAKAEDAD